MCCRLCLKSSTELHYIITSELKCAELTLVESLYWIFGVDVDVNDDYSKFICVRCENVIEYVGCYRTLYQRNQLILEEKLDYQNEGEEWLNQLEKLDIKKGFETRRKRKANFQQVSISKSRKDTFLEVHKTNADTLYKDKEDVVEITREDKSRNEISSVESPAAKRRRLKLIEHYYKTSTTAIQELIKDRASEVMGEKLNNVPMVKIKAEEEEDRQLFQVNGEVEVMVCKFCNKIYKTNKMLAFHYESKHKLERTEGKTKMIRGKFRRRGGRLTRKKRHLQKKKTKTDKSDTFSKEIEVRHSALNKILDPARINKHGNKFLFDAKKLPTSNEIKSVIVKGDRVSIRNINNQHKWLKLKDFYVSVEKCDVPVGFLTNSDPVTEKTRPSNYNKKKKLKEDVPTKTLSQIGRLTKSVEISEARPTEQDKTETTTEVHSIICANEITKAPKLTETTVEKIKKFAKILKMKDTSALLLQVRQFTEDEDVKEKLLRSETFPERNDKITEMQKTRDHIMETLQKIQRIKKMSAVKQEAKRLNTELEKTGEHSIVLRNSATKANDIKKMGIMPRMDTTKEETDTEIEDAQSGEVEMFSDFEDTDIGNLPTIDISDEEIELQTTVNFKTTVEPFSTTVDCKDNSMVIISVNVDNLSERSLIDRYRWLNLKDFEISVERCAVPDEYYQISHASEGKFNNFGTDTTVPASLYAGKEKKKKILENETNSTDKMKDINRWKEQVVAKLIGLKKIQDNTSVQQKLDMLNGEEGTSSTEFRTGHFKNKIVCMEMKNENSKEEIKTVPLSYNFLLGRQDLPQCLKLLLKLKDFCISVEKCAVPTEYYRNNIIEDDIKNSEENEPGKCVDKMEEVIILEELTEVEEKENENTNEAEGSEKNGEHIGVVLSDKSDELVMETTDNNNEHGKENEYCENQIRTITLSHNYCISSNDINLSTNLNNQYKWPNLKDLCISLKRHEVPKSFKQQHDEILEQDINNSKTTSGNNHTNVDKAEMTKWRGHIKDTIRKLQNIKKYELSKQKLKGLRTELKGVSNNNTTEHADKLLEEQKSYRDISATENMHQKGNGLDSQSEIQKNNGVIGAPETVDEDTELQNMQECSRKNIETVVTTVNCLKEIKVEATPSDNILSNNDDTNKVREMEVCKEGLSAILSKLQKIKNSKIMKQKLRLDNNIIRNIGNDEKKELTIVVCEKTEEKTDNEEDFQDNVAMDIVDGDDGVEYQNIDKDFLEGSNRNVPIRDCCEETIEAVSHNHHSKGDENIRSISESYYAKFNLKNICISLERCLLPEFNSNKETDELKIDDTNIEDKSGNTLLVYNNSDIVEKQKDIKKWKNGISGTLLRLQQIRTNTSENHTSKICEVKLIEAEGKRLLNTNATATDIIDEEQETIKDEGAVDDSTNNNSSRATDPESGNTKTIQTCKESGNLSTQVDDDPGDGEESFEEETKAITVSENCLKREYINAERMAETQKKREQVSATLLKIQRIKQNKEIQEKLKQLEAISIEKEQNKQKFLEEYLIPGKIEGKKSKRKKKRMSGDNINLNRCYALRKTNVSAPNVDSLLIEEEHIVKETSQPKEDDNTSHNLENVLQPINREKVSSVCLETDKIPDFTLQKNNEVKKNSYIKEVSKEPVNLKRSDMSNELPASCDSQGIEPGKGASTCSEIDTVPNFTSRKGNDIYKKTSKIEIVNSLESDLSNELPTPNDSTAHKAVKKNKKKRPRSDISTADSKDAIRPNSSDFMEEFESDREERVPAIKTMDVIETLDKHQSIYGENPKKTLCLKNLKSCRSRQKFQSKTKVEEEERLTREIEQLTKWLSLLKIIENKGIDYIISNQSNISSAASGHEATSGETSDGSNYKLISEKVDDGNFKRKHVIGTLDSGSVDEVARTKWRDNLSATLLKMRRIKERIQMNKIFSEVNLMKRNADGMSPKTKSSEYIDNTHRNCSKNEGILETTAQLHNIRRSNSVTEKRPDIEVSIEDENHVKGIQESRRQDSIVKSTTSNIEDCEVIRAMKNMAPGATDKINQITDKEITLQEKLSTDLKNDNTEASSREITQLQ